MFEQIGNLVDDFVRAYLRKTKTLLALGEPARRRPQRETVQHKHPRAAARRWLSKSLRGGSKCPRSP